MAVISIVVVKVVWFGPWSSRGSTVESESIIAKGSRCRIEFSKALLFRVSCFVSAQRAPEMGVSALRVESSFSLYIWKTVIFYSTRKRSNESRAGIRKSVVRFQPQPGL